MASGTRASSGGVYRGTDRRVGTRSAKKQVQSETSHPIWIY